MSLMSEMSRMTAEFGAAQGARLAAIGKIGSNVKREGHRNRAALRRTMAAHRAATKSSLRDIFGTAAFTRGAAEELIDRFRNDREAAASDLRNELVSYASNLRETVGAKLASLAATRAKMARREENLRRTALKDLRRRVENLLGNAGMLIEGIGRDRQRAGRIWEQHLRNTSRQRRAAQAAAKDMAAPHKPARRATAKRRKRARS